MKAVMRMNIMSIDTVGTTATARDNTLALAMAYVPMQCLKTIYSPQTALLRGTLFPELDKPFTGRKGGTTYG